MEDNDEERSVTFFSCPYLGGLVELNDERERHIREKHSAMLPDLYRYIATTLAEPEHIQRSQTHDNTRLFTRWDESRAKYVIVVVVSDVDPRDWIVTAYIADKPAKGATEWIRN
ncbi:MAG: hypothetical protein F4X64_07435 [Chloroflexi bacterium]|nr:hypothetical protein [Chloroflexota bacterium]